MLFIIIDSSTSIRNHYLNKRPLFNRCTLHQINEKYLERYFNIHYKKYVPFTFKNQFNYFGDECIDETIIFY
ncbi:hypothetical protein BpHYR1_041492 [Brachionus plicatilis]|uniref:Uncharacterized protein n=1 Tax=Brachionus plicatilis TaxID=10195 RepID=A0A3M7S7C5_BRAPC|nr:hypothetical protein BpHYR1_041492 [Brachionus plicatilis]